MRSERGVLGYLVEHFFRRFFDNDTLQSGGDTQTSVVRAFSFVAMPGLMFGFWLQNEYPRRTLWGSIEDQYFFVLFSFVVMGLVAIFEWEMLFPDRLDFLILSPTSVKPAKMLGAKAVALGAFIALFLVGCNVCGTFVLPAVTTHVATVNGHLQVVSDFWRQFAAHAVAVSLAGLFAALFFVASGGVLLCVLSAREFRLISPVVQTLSVMGLLLLLIGYLQHGAAMEQLLGGQLGWVRWDPTLWFLAVYEQLLHGSAAPAFAQQLSVYAYRSVVIVVLVAVTTYPMAWARMCRMAIEGGAVSKGEPSRWLATTVHRLIRRPGERAIFHFIGQTITRNNQYQVYLAMYCGTGLALAAACAITFRESGTTGWALSDKGLHAVMPLLVFWVVAGVRGAFAFPLNLPAAWVYRVTRVSADALNDAAEAGARWALFSALGVAALVAAGLACLGWDARRLLVQMICGVCLAVLLTDAFFLFLQRVPFAQPRMPGKTSLPLMLTLYLGVLPVFLFEMVRFEMKLEHNLTTLFFVACGVAASHLAILKLSRRPAESEEEMEGYEGEFQLLNLAER